MQRRLVPQQEGTVAAPRRPLRAVFEYCRSYYLFS